MQKERSPPTFIESKWMRSNVSSLARPCYDAPLIFSLIATSRNFAAAHLPHPVRAGGFSPVTAMTGSSITARVEYSHSFPCQLFSW